MDSSKESQRNSQANMDMDQPEETNDNRFVYVFSPFDPVQQLYSLSGQNVY